MNLRVFLITVIALLLFVRGSAHGHHSFAVEFTAEETAVINGVVAEVWFKNPHVRYYVYPYECDPDSFYRQMYEQGKLDMYYERSERRQMN